MIKVLGGHLDYLSKHILGVTDSPQVQKVSITKNSRKCNLANSMKRSCLTFTVT